MKTRIKSLLPVAVICLAAVLIELLLSNFVWISYVRGRDEVQDFVPSGFTQEIINENDNSFAVDGIDFPVNSVSYTVKTADPEAADTLLTAAYYIADEASTASAALARRERIAATPEGYRVTSYVNSYGNGKYVDITFEEVKGELIVTDFTLNPSYKFGFDALRFAFVFAFLMLIYVFTRTKAGESISEKFTYTHADIIAVAVCVVPAVAVWIMNASGEDGNCIFYPLEYGAEHYSPYIQQFDAFMKGQLHFDVQPSAEMLALSNPYSPDERHGLDFLYDRAFFDGKYYSYFGIAPILTVYYPLYLLTGVLPADSTVTGIFSVITAIFLPLAVVEWSRFKKYGSPLLAFICGAGAYFASGALIIQRGRAPFYYIASIAGTAFVAVFLFLIINAVQFKKTAPRMIFLALSGGAYALAFMSRVNSVLPVTFGIIAFILIYLIKSIKEKSLPVFFKDMTALGLPVVLALGFTLWYNNARFGSPLQFGTAYQLTVADTSYYEFYGGGIFHTLFHYFIQPLEITDMFPFVQFEYFRLAGYGRSLYIDSNFGMLAIPFMLSLLLSPVIFRSKTTPKQSKIMLSVLLISLGVTAYADMCMGGVIFRYTADLLPAGAFLSAAILFEVYRIAKEKYGEGIAHSVCKGSGILAGVTAVVVSAVVVGINGNFVSYAPEFHLALRDFFVFWS